MGSSLLQAHASAAQKLDQAPGSSAPGGGPPLADASGLSLWDVARPPLRALCAARDTWAMTLRERLEAAVRALWVAADWGAKQTARRLVTSDGAGTMSAAATAVKRRLAAALRPLLSSAAGLLLDWAADLADGSALALRGRDALSRLPVATVVSEHFLACTLIAGLAVAALCCVLARVCRAAIRLLGVLRAAAVKCVRTSRAASKEARSSVIGIKGVSSLPSVRSDTSRRRKRAKRV